MRINTLIALLLIGIVSCQGKRSGRQSIVVSSATLKNHCDRQNNIDVMVHIRRRLSITEPSSPGKLAVKVSACRSSWANKFCKSSDAIRIVQACNMVRTKIRGAIEKQVFKCGLNKKIFCALRSTGAAWNMATYVVTMEINDGQQNKKHKVSVTPFLLVQQCSNLDQALLDTSSCGSGAAPAALSMNPVIRGSNTVVVDQTKLNFTQLMLSLQSALNTLSKSTGLKDKLAKLGAPDP